MARRAFFPRRSASPPDHGPGDDGVPRLEHAPVVEHPGVPAARRRGRDPRARSFFGVLGRRRAGRDSRWRESLLPVVPFDYIYIADINIITPIQLLPSLQYVPYVHSYFVFSILTRHFISQSLHLFSIRPTPYIMTHFTPINPTHKPCC